MDKYQLLYEWAKLTVKASDSGDLLYLFTSTDDPFDQWMKANGEYIDDLHDHDDGGFAIITVKKNSGVFTILTARTKPVC